MCINSAKAGYPGESDNVQVVPFNEYAVFPVEAIATNLSSPKAISNTSEVSNGGEAT
jgi:hypothetical protein